MPNKLASKTGVTCIVPFDIRYPAGIRVNSLGMGKNVLSMKVMKNIPKYPNLSTKSKIKVNASSTNPVNIFQKKIVLFCKLIA